MAAETAVCKHCGRTKRQHWKSNRLRLWFCKTGSKWFEPADPEKESK